MKTTLILAAALWLFPVGLSAADGANATATNRRPNILFIAIDDLRPELGCYGAPVKTPNIDKLATASVRFDRAYCQYPLCNPSRASLLTGLHPTQTGVLNNGGKFRASMPDLITLPQLFKQNGYTTVRNGKVYHGGIDDPASWSEGAEDKPKARAARTHETAAPAQPRKATEPRDDGKPRTEFQGPVTAQMRASDQRVVLAGDGESHGDYRSADAAIAALERLKDQPFFITCGFTKPHAAPSAPQRFYDMHPLDKISLPADFGPFPKPPAGFPAAALTKQNTDVFWNREATADEAKLMLQAYRASTSWVDWNVGRVLAVLDKLGLRERTIVVLWGDHGYHLGEMGKWSKHSSLFEVGTRVPLLISVPGAKGNGKASARIVQSLDLYPTLAALCGLQPPAGLAGHDLRPLLENPAAPWAHPAFTVAGTAGQLHRSVREERWRYIEWNGPDGGAALIDEDKDPHERTNLVNDPAHAETVRKLKASLQTLPSR